MCCIDDACTCATPYASRLCYKSRGHSQSEKCRIGIIYDGLER